VLVELSLGDADGFGEVFAWQLGIDDRVAVVFQASGFDALRKGSEAEEDDGGCGISSCFSLTTLRQFRRFARWQV
jgi:hypothetical protein